MCKHDNADLCFFKKALPNEALLKVYCEKTGTFKVEGQIQATSSNDFFHSFSPWDPIIVYLKKNVSC